MKGLIIREPWISKILNGTKTWEMRGKPTSYRGYLGLIRQGTGMIVGVAELAGSLPALNAIEFREARSQHGIPSERDTEVLSAGWVYPWVLKNVRLLKRSISSMQKPGAVIWVTLPLDVVQEASKQWILAANSADKEQIS